MPEWIKVRHFHLRTEDGEQLFRTRAGVRAYLSETMEPWKVAETMADVKPCSKVCEIKKEE